MFINSLQKYRPEMLSVAEVIEVKEAHKVVRVTKHYMLQSVTWYKAAQDKLAEYALLP